MNLGDGATLLLVTEPFFKTITGKDIPDTTTANEVALAVQVDGRERVDEILATAQSNGGKETGQTEDNEFLYSRAFHDLDGHLWNVLHMHRHR